MNSFKQKLISFMYGRYGIDELYIGLLVLWLIIGLLNTAVFRSPVVSVIASIIVVFAIYRTMSKKYDRRRRENQMFLKLWTPIKNYLTYIRDRIRDRKTARYRKCKHCRAIIKLPNKKGKHTVLCPKCGERFNVRI